MGMAIILSGEADFVNGKGKALLRTCRYGQLRASFSRGNSNFPGKRDI